MTEENKTESNLKTAMDSVAGIVKEVPIYQDTLQPAARELGKSLETVAKTVRIALAPIKALVWGYDKIEEFLNTRVTEKLKNVPAENITTPPPQIAGPAVEALKYAGHDNSLRELYANLLANAMDINSIDKVHPAFVEIIKNISSDEAVLLQNFINMTQFPVIDFQAVARDNKGYLVIVANHTHLYKDLPIKRPDLTPSYIDNLCRLGILEIPAGVLLLSEGNYEPLENDSQLDSAKNQTKLLERDVKFLRKMVRTTIFGRQFIQNVVCDKAS